MHIGVDLGGTKTECIILDQKGKEIERLRKETPKNYYGTLETVCELVNFFEKKYKVECSVGIGTPGALSKETNCIKGGNSTWINDRPLKKDIELRLNRSIFFENDANCFALSESYDGAGVEHEIVFGVIIGTGVGGGLVINNKIINGFNNITGEWGHNQMTEEHINYMLSKIPRNKFAKVNELASLVTYLASEENSFATAAVFDLSGGRATY